MTKRPATDQVVLRRATIADAAALSTFAARIFVETFGPDNKPDDMEAYIAGAFGPDIQAAEIEDSASTIILAIDHGAPDRQMVGYAHLIAEADGMKLSRLYVDKSWQGTGLAKLLMERVYEQCRAEGTDRLWLTTWTQNTRAIAFYEKIGFRITGSETFMVGEDAQTDHVMEKAVPQAPSEG